MHILSSFLFGISANTDNFVVGVSYGMKKIKIDLASNLLIALINLAGTVLSMSAGKAVFHFIPVNLSNMIGSIILILIGCFTILKPLLARNDSDGILEHPEKADMDNSKSIEIKESVVLALALTINNIGLGIGASITGLNIAITAIFTVIIGLATIMLGYSLGSRFLSKAFGRSTAILSGLLIIGLGIYELLI